MNNFLNKKSSVFLAKESLIFRVSPRLYRVPLRSVNINNDDSSKSHSFILLGATGDLARREIYPSLWKLYRGKMLPENIRIYGYSLLQVKNDCICERVRPFISVKPGEEQLYEKFWSINRYVNSTKNQWADYKHIDELLDKAETVAGGNRIFYLALPPSAFATAGIYIKQHVMAKRGYTRVVIQKPFGHNLESSNALSKKLSNLFTEEQMYRMDHFLGYEMVQNLLMLRFANRMLQSSWNKDHIAAVKIDFKENFGIEGRGAFFDNNGIIRDVMQNHLLQIMSLIAMEEPKSAHSNHVRDAKVALLKNTREIVINDVIVGQYIGNKDSKNNREHIGYLEEETVTNKQSISPTFASTVLRVDNERWQGVPFIIRAGKSLGDNKTEVIIQYKNVDNYVFSDKTTRNEFVIRIGKTPALQAKIMSKVPGITTQMQNILIDFDYEREYKNLDHSDAYVKLILDVFNGSQLNFVRSDELKEAWTIFTPILHKLKNDKIKPKNYKFGSSGPKEADDLEKKNNFL